MIIPYRRALALLAPLLLSTACGTADPAADAPGADGAAATAAATTRMSSTADLNGKRLGVVLGSVYDKFATKTYPAATVLTFDAGTDLQQAVLADKVDAALTDEEGLLEMFGTSGELAMLGEPILRLPLGAGFRKDNTALLAAFNGFLRDIRANGVYADMVDRWVVRHETTMPVIKAPPASGTITVGVAGGGLPFGGIQNGVYVGFDAEMLQRFAASQGKSITLVQMPFGGLIAANASGKIDMIVASMFITEERKERIAFSDPYFETNGRAYARTANIAPASASAPGAPATTGAMFRSTDDLDGKRIGVQLGTVYDSYATKTYPRATVVQFPTYQDVTLAVTAGKVDAGLSDVETLAELMLVNTALVPFGEPLFSSPVGAGFAKSRTELRSAFNAFLTQIRGNGVYDDMVTRWMKTHNRTMPTLPATPTNGVLVVGLSSGGFPFAAVQNGEHAGFDIELARRFGASLGKDVRFADQEFGGLIAALISGKVDVIIADMYITEERQKSIDFSDPYFAQANVAFTNKVNTVAPSTGAAPAATRASWIDGIVSSFQSNIMQEKRYLLIWDGLTTTTLIAVLSALFGTVLGALICFMRLSSRALLRLPAQAFIAVLRGTPVVVLLMLMFYVVFGSININPVIVAVIAFGMNFAAYVAEIFRSGIEGIDAGQSEAGTAMGFTRVQTFRFVIMPQMIQRILPVYKGECISMVKMTSIVGYIAVQDLTKASDIIRSRTFDAFFPLVMVAVLYFLLAGILMQALGALERTTDPRRRRLAAR
ncbi:MAG: ABC transporter permease subunit [Gemmatimonadota bacterium]|nr:ABC transporter permease subunit [Gemmatimonadota bacterium]